MDRLTTEKQTLGFFGALCGVMVSQLPELRAELGLDLASALGAVGCITGLILSLTYIRRSIGQSFNVLVLLALMCFAFCGLALMWRELSQAAMSGVSSLTAMETSYLVLKVVIIVYMVSWSIMAYIDGEGAST
jgi:uncharacterized protein YqgC (DUF456 family)